jgi:MSHA biogenesis protein MshL
MRYRPVIVFLVLLLTACATVEQAKEPPPVIPWPVEIPSPVMVQPEREKKVDKANTREQFSFSLREADVKDVLRAVAKQADYNVVIEPDVKGLSTVDLKDVTLEKALEYILEPLNYSHKIEDRTVYVSRPKLETKVFSVNYVALKKTGLSTVIGVIGGGAGGSSGGTGGGTSTGMSETKAVEVKSETESDIWKSLEENLKNMLSKDGQLVMNKQALIVLISDYPRNLKNIATFFQAVEGTIHRQVMIEARIIEVQLNEYSREGINWKFLGSFLQGQSGEFTLGLQQVFMNPTISSTASTSALAQTPYFRLFVGSNKFDIDKTFLDLLKTQGTINVISSPKIATLNNQRAVIKVAKQDVYFEETQSTGTGSSGLATYTPRFMTIGLILDVTPQIDNVGNIMLSIHPMVTEKVGEVSAPSGNKVPILDVREADTMVRMKEGETVIIGGLMKERKKVGDTGVKGLMNIPLIGKLFNLHEDEIIKTELVVILTPRMIYDRDTK